MHEEIENILAQIEAMLRAIGKQEEAQPGAYQDEYDIELYQAEGFD